MFLDPLRIALQGLGFPLSPIAMAVQGFIAELQEEERARLEYHGGGGRQRGPAFGRRDAAALPEPQPHRRQMDEAEVRAQWELLDLRRENRRRDALAREARRAAQALQARAPAPVDLGEAIRAGQGDGPEATAAKDLDADSNEALLLLLALA